MAMNRELFSRRAGAIGTRGTVLAASAVALALAAVFVAYRTRKTERDNPPQGRFVYVDGVKLHYIERGEGQPLVLLHGNGSMVQDFELSGLIDLASQRYRVIAFDRPGYGHSDPLRARYWDPQAQARIIFKGLQQLEVERPVVFGHSWGTLVALAMALNHQQDIGGIVLASGYYYPSLRPSLPALAMPAVPGIGTAMRHTISPLLSRAVWTPFQKRLFAPDSIPPRFSAFPKWMAMRPSQLRVTAGEAGVMMVEASKLVKRAGELTLPVTIMAGDADKYVSASWHSERLAREIPHATFRPIYSVGHMLHYFVPLEVMAAIKEVSAEATRRASPLFEPNNIASPGLHAAT